MPTDPSRQLFQNYFRHYQAGGADRSQVPIDQVRKLRLDRLPRWLNRIPRDAHILDAGCATGYTLGLLWETDYHQLTGVELSEQLAQLAKASLPPKVTIINSDIRDFLTQAPDASFDVILFHHVLEHIPREHIIDLLSELHRCLKPGGHLNIKVPNASYLLAGHHLFCDFTHVACFNERSLPQVLEAANFDTGNIELILHPPTLFWSWRHMGRAILRLLNRIRWNIHRAIHYTFCALIELRPTPICFEWELELIARK